MWLVPLPTCGALDDVRVWQKVQAASSGSSDDFNTSGIRAVKDFFKGLFGK
jgi:hypothetical protein